MTRSDKREKILLVEDDDGIGTGLHYALEAEGYLAEWVKSLGEARKRIRDREFDLMILDLTLPDGNGYELCRDVKIRIDMPVIFLTAFDDEINVVMGLEMGADDYISKPFRLKELLARIKAVLRRCKKTSQSDVISYRELKIHTQEAKVFKGKREIVLTAMEYKLLLVFAANMGHAMTRNSLLEQLWDVEGDFVNDNTLTVYIKRLREKLEDPGAEPVYIQTVRGIGYVFGRE